MEVSLVNDGPVTIVIESNVCQQGATAVDEDIITVESS
jgi:hypothetical protein